MIDMKIDLNDQYGFSALSYLTSSPGEIGPTTRRSRPLKEQNLCLSVQRLSAKIGGGESGPPA